MGDPMFHLAKRKFMTMMPLKCYHLISACALFLHTRTVDAFDLYLGGRTRLPGPSSNLAIDRRSIISTIGSFATGTLVIASTPRSVLASDTNTSQSTVNENSSKLVVNEYIIDNFTVSLPSTWKVTSKPISSTNESKRNQNSKIFAAIDLQSGSVITIVKEQVCNAQEYAQSSTKTCSILMPADKDIFLEDTIAKDVTKLLIRHDDRDNTALQGTTTLNSYILNHNILELAATTTIPSGGTYRDTMGIDRPNTIDRKVKAKAVINIPKRDEQASSPQPTNVMTLWLSAPLDEWQKPVMGTKLNQIWDSIELK